MNAPRLLPLIGIAVVGVVAINALAGARDWPQLVSAARAMAEGAPAPDKTAKPAKGAKTDKAADAAGPAAPPLPPLGATPPGVVPAGVCAPDAAELAKSAGLSPAELQMLQNLQNRRGQIDQREKDLDTQVQLMAAAEIKLDAKLKAMNDLKAQIEALLGQADQKTQGEVDRLVAVYTKMSPGPAAAVMSQLEDGVKVRVAAGLKPAVLAAILNKMNSPDAKKLTELLAHRFAPVQQLADAARRTVSPPPPAAPAAPATPAKPDQKAAAASPSADDANVDDAKAKPVKKAKPPAKLARRAKRPGKGRRAIQQARAKAKADPTVSPAKDAQPKAADAPAAKASAS